MRRNSGDDQGRDLNLDPTMKERERAHGKSGAAVLDSKAKSGAIASNRHQRATGMGSNAHKSKHKGDQRIR